uniref:Uncharacterized protein n=1 Tax=Anguilla anguilla TaxID=7936 RepID=A0A0E9XF02_ANGAN
MPVSHTSLLYTHFHASNLSGEFIHHVFLLFNIPMCSCKTTISFQNSAQHSLTFPTFSIFFLIFAISHIFTSFSHFPQ